MKRIVFFTLVIAGSLLPQACIHFCTEPPMDLVYIFKFKEGTDYSNHVYAIAYVESQSWWCDPVKQIRPTPLHDGYYIANYTTCSARDAAENMMYFKYTLEQYFNGEVETIMFPSANDTNVIAQDPFVEFYKLSEDHNPGNLPFNSVHDSIGTQYDFHITIDTNILNSIIDNGELSHYFQRIK